jgi:MscS family membrane protein
MTNARRYWSAMEAAALLLAPLAAAALALAILMALAPAAVAQAPGDSIAPAQPVTAPVSAPLHDPAIPNNSFALWLHDALPASFHTSRLLGLELWQWVGLVLAAVAAVVIGQLIARLAALIGRHLVRRTKATWDDVLLEMAIGSLNLAIIVFIFFFGSQLLALPLSAQHVVASTCKVAAILAVTWFLLRAIDMVTSILHARSFPGHPAAVSLLPMARRAVKTFVMVIALVSLLQNVGFNVTGLVAGLGVGGLAIALAAQKTLENLFGGIAILIDRPVKVGDLCTIGSHNGVVEEIGSRSTRIRTSARTLVAIPNAEFSTSRIENFAARDYTVMQTLLPLANDASPEQLHRVLDGIRSALASHPMVIENPRRVSLIHIGPYSYDIEVAAGIRTTNQEAFIQHREELFLKIVDIVAACGARFAVPPQSLAASPPPAAKPGGERKA